MPDDSSVMSQSSLNKGVNLNTKHLFDCEGGIKGRLTFHVREDTLQKQFYLGLCPKQRIPPAPKIWDGAETFPFPKFKKSFPLTPVVSLVMDLLGSELAGELGKGCPLEQ